MHIADWYRTFANLAGVDAEDYRAAQYGLPPIDSLDMWPLISGANLTSPRTEIPFTPDAIIQGNYKLLTGGDNTYAVWTGPVYPNRTSNLKQLNEKLHCHHGCLFDVVNDPSERNDISKQNPNIVLQMQQALFRARQFFYQNQEKGPNYCGTHDDASCFCSLSKRFYGGCAGPYQYLDTDFLNTATVSSR